MALRDILIRFGVEVDQAPLDRAQGSADRLLGTLRRGMGVVQAFAAAFAAREVMALADTFTTLNNRIRVVTADVREFNEAQEELLQVARDTYRPIEDVATVFQRYRMATSELGLAQSDVLDLTKRLIQASAVGGGSAQETSGALIQLAQGIATNFEAAGQEVRALQENAPLLAKIIAEAAGGSAGDLMSLAKAGKISGELVVNAVRSAGGDLDEQFGKRLPTYAEGFTRLWLELVVFVGTLNEITGAGRGFVQAITWIADRIRDLTPWLRKFFRQVSFGNLIIGAGVLALFKWASAVKLGAATVTRLLPLVRGLFRALMRFVLPVLIVDELITLFRGGDTLIGRFLDKMFGVGAAAKFVEGAKTAFQSLVDTLTLVLQWMGILEGKPVDLEAAFLRASEGIGRIFDSLFSWLGGAFERFAAWVGEQILRIPGLKKGLQFAGVDTSALDQPPLAGFRMDREPMLSPAATAAVAPSAVSAPVSITNEITVQGNATPAVAREIAQRTGQATAVAGRDRAAIGAAVGVTQ